MTTQAQSACGKCKRPCLTLNVGLCSWCHSFIDLPGRLQATLDRLEVDKADQDALHAFLAPVRVKEPVHTPTYEHCLRVGLTAASIAEFMHMDGRALLFAGLMHDVGKALVLLSTLSKTQGWTAEDSKEMECHIEDSYRMVRGRFDFSAQVLIWHHQFQQNAYPVELPPPLHPYSKGTEVTIAMYGRILALADGYDALHRVNFQDGQVRARSDSEIRELMLARNPDQTILVTKLYEAGVLL